MITSFGNRLAEDLFYDRKKSRALKKFPPELFRVARRKLLYIFDASVLSDLKVPPGNKLEALKGDLKGYHSIRINSQWRVIFVWNRGASDVQIVDYHK
jgi:proteic killer suppression protein